MQLSRLLGLVTLTLSINALPNRSVYRLHEERATEPLQWVKNSRVEAEVILPVRIGLTQTNLDNGPALLEEVSTPGSAKYGQHYTAEEIHDLFAPSGESVTAIRDWLHDAGIQSDRVSLSTNKQWIQLDASVQEVEGLIQTEYYHYEHVVTGGTNIGCDKYHVPEHVAHHIDYITPGLKLLTSSKSKPDLEKRIFGVTAPGTKPVLGPILKTLSTPIAILLGLALEIACPIAILPGCIKAMYNITDPPKEVAPSNQLGIFEDLGDTYSQADLDAFFLALATFIPVGTHPTLNGIDGATAPTNVTSAGPESDLDFQISFPILHPQGSILYQTDDDVYQANYNFAGFFNNFLDAIDGTQSFNDAMVVLPRSYCSYSAFGETGNSKLDPSYPDPASGGYKGKLQCGFYKPTNVISLSYGGQEADLPPSYQQRQCNEYMKLGMQGHSIVFASGDSGVAGPANDGSANGCLSGGTVFSPDFPATCPYVTAVGATYLPPGSDVFEDQETAVTDFASGGGFSNIYPIPSYQSKAVANYFATSPPSYKSYSATNNSNVGTNGGIYNRAGRGYPDVSAIGDNVVIFNKGAPTLIGGTSAAAPVFASILTRINEERIAAGKSTIGFVNPTLYANPGAFHDITTGSNPGCGTNGFSAAKGWDPVTGLGTPNYPALLDVFMKI